MGENEVANEQVNYGVHEGAVRSAIVNENVQEIDCTGLPIEVYIDDIDSYSNEEYATLRKNTLGASDSSIVLGVNPYKTPADLIKEKAATTLTEEEKAVGDLTAVRKGRDLEPLIIEKDAKCFNRKIFKPKDMYRFLNGILTNASFPGIETREAFLEAFLPKEGTRNNVLTENSYGAGIVGMEADGEVFYTHGGDIPGYHSDLFYFPESGKGFCVMISMVSLLDDENNMEEVISELYASLFQLLD